MHLIKRLETIGAAKPPKWLADNTLYLTQMGSHAYGCSTEDSDVDVYGFCVPPKDLVFPHLAGEVPGFGRQPKRFDQFQSEHLRDPDARAGKGEEYDVAVYSIVRYFQLVMEGNPNMVDSLFTPVNCIIHSTAVSELVRERRGVFLSKKCWHTFKGYSFSQLHKMSSKTPDPTGKRIKLREQFGYDVKFGMHLVRLLGEVEQILATGDIDLQRDKEMLKDIRRGNWTEQQVRDYFMDQQPRLENLYHTSKAVPHEPDEPAIKALLLECLEHHYGSLSQAVVVEGKAEQAVREIKAVIERLGV
jgi:predicted nucleotidyltransferase